MKYTDKQIEYLLAGIYAGVITEYELPKDLYFAIADYLKKALYKGFGGALADFDGKDLELLTELRENVYMFSAAKTYQEVLEIKSLLYDEDGNFRSSKEFNQLGREKYDLWNDTYGQTEYNTCVGQAQQARQWNEIEKNKEMFPYLRYIAVMDANTSDICAPLNDVVLPVDDSLWNSYSPLNHFNCFTPETKILTQNGWIRIDKIQKGDLIIGGSGKKQYVLGVHVNAIESEIVRISIKNNSVSSTKNHRFLTIDGWKMAENIKVGDIIVQNIQVGFFNKIICAINNSYVVFRYLGMSIKRKWESAAIDTFNSDIVFRNKNINKPIIYKFVSDAKNSNPFNKIKNFLLAISKRFVVLSHSVWFFVVRFYCFLISFTPNFLIKHRVFYFHSNGSIGSFFAKHRMSNTISNFGKSFRGFFFSFFGIYPLSFNGITPFSRLNIAFFHKSNQSPIVNTPSVTNLSVRKKLFDINEGEGFVNGQPLNKFNSLFDFTCNSFFHRRFVLVKKIEKFFYSGQIYNLSVNIDESYITNVGVVHNCRCVLEQLDRYEDVKETPQSQVDEVEKELKHKVQDAFKMNPGKDGYIFSPKHPYFDVADKDFAKQNFNLPIPPKD